MLFAFQSKHKKKTPPPPASKTTPYKANTMPKITPPNVPNQKTSLGNTLLEGFAFGTGSSVAKEIVNKILQENQSHNQDATPNPSSDSKKKCKELETYLEQCLHSGFDCSDTLEKYFVMCGLTK